MGTLYIVATPIGNLQDISLRAKEILTTVFVIACEDTRRTGVLLHHLREGMPPIPEEQKPRLISYYEQNEHYRIPEILTLLKDGIDVALISDAGTPAISDPGFKLIRQCRQEGIPIVGVPGASSVILALVVSGLPTDKFSFLGYLPHKKSHAQKMLEDVVSASTYIKQTTIFFEAPHKLLKTLELMKEVLGDREIVLCRELTKTYEEVTTDTLEHFITRFKKTSPKGEIILLLPAITS